MVGFVLVSSANQMLWLNFAPITTSSAHRLGVSTSTIGVLSEVFPLLYVLLALPMGLALDRWFRPGLAAGAVLTAGGATLRLAGHGFAPVLIGQLVVAVAQPLVLSAVTGLATRSLRPEDRPVGIAVGSAGTFLGFVIAFVLGLGLGAPRLHALLVSSAAYSIGAALVLIVALHAVPPPAEIAGPVAGISRRAAQVANLRAVWDDGVIRITVIIVFFGFGVFVAITTWVQTLLQPSGVDVRTADGLLIAMVTAGIVSSVLVPPVVARRRNPSTAIAVAAVGGLVACLVLAALPGRATGYAALSLFGLVLLPALPILLELIEHRAPERANTATALLWLSGNAGGLVVALGVGGLTGHPAVAFGLMAAVALVVLPLARSLREHLAPLADGVAPGQG
jgi:predicted MFS family arabinose efflux permease